MAAATHTLASRITLGNKVLVITNLADGSGTGTTISKNSLGLARIENAWLGDTGDNARLTLTITSSQITLSAATNGGTSQLFVIGF
jgi:hypothetical protein